jgi:hypothetical protein
MWMLLSYSKVFNIYGNVAVASGVARRFQNTSSRQCAPA